MRRKPKYKPLLFTTTVRSPERYKRFLRVLKEYDGKVLTDELATEIAGEIVKHGLYKPKKMDKTVRSKIAAGDYDHISNEEIQTILRDNPQKHKEAGFEWGWPSRFDTWFKLAKELGFVYYKIGEKIKFSKTGLMLIDPEHPEFEQQLFLNALAKYQRNNPFRRVLNENAPLILLLEVILKLNQDKEFNGAGISSSEIPLISFWKDNDSEKLFKLIKEIRKKYGYSPSPEVITGICVNNIMGGKFKKFKQRSIVNDYQDEFIRKMRLTGLISLRGGGRFIDINKNEEEKVAYVLRNYSKYKKYETEKEYFKYMSKIDKNLFSTRVMQTVSKEDREKSLIKWVRLYSWRKIREEMIIVSKRGNSHDDTLKYLDYPVRLEFLTALAIKTKFPNVKVIPNYPYDDEGLPTSTAGGTGNKGDIECFENHNGILIEVTMSEGRIQTVAEIWPIGRHLEEFSKTNENSMCYFIAPSIFEDSLMQIDYLKDKKRLLVIPKTIKEFLQFIEKRKKLFFSTH